jgi:hypothetical protein
MQLPGSSYLQVKADTLAGRANYDWFVGSGWDRKIPTAYYANGLQLDDQSLHDATAGSYQHKNLPLHRQNLYAEHSDDGGDGDGFFRWSDDMVALDLAPIIPNQRMPGFNRIAACIAGEQALPMPHQLSGTRRSQTFLASEMNAVQVDPGNNFGLLHYPPALGPFRRGAYTTVPSFLT